MNQASKAVREHGAPDRLRSGPAPDFGHGVPEKENMFPRGTGKPINSEQWLSWIVGREVLWRPDTRSRPSNIGNKR